MASVQRDGRFRNFLLGLVALVIATAQAATVSSAGATISATPDVESPSCNDERPSGTILYLPGTESPGEPSNIVEAIDPSGKPKGNIGVPNAVTLADVGVPNRALVTTRNTEYFIVNSTLASAPELSFSGDANKPIDLNSLSPKGSNRWRLNNAFDENTIQLVDLETGNVQDLETWLPSGMMSPLGATISDSGEYVAIEPFDSHQGLLIGPTNDLTRLQNFGRGSAIELSFSPDDKWVAFERYGQYGRNELIVSEVDNPDSQIVVSDDVVSFPVMVSDPDRVIFIDSTAEDRIALKVFDVASNSTITVFDGEGAVALFTIKANGKFAVLDVISVPGSGESYMVIVDLMSGVHSTVSAHSNSHPYYPIPPDGELHRTSSRWVPLITLESAESGPSTTLPQYVLDFETGVLSNLKLDADWWNANTHAASVDGRYWAYEVTNEGTQNRVALLDLVTSATRTIVAGEPSGVDFSPDDCWIAFSVYEGSPETNRPIIYIAHVSGGPITKVAEGRQPVWLES